MERPTKPLHRVFVAPAADGDAADCVRVLVADPDLRIVAHTRRVLEREGYLTAGVYRGADALGQVEDWQPHLLLLGSALGDLDSGEVCRRIKTACREPGCLVVMVAGGRASAEEQAAALAAGADGYLSRPLGNRELVAWVNAWARVASLERARSADRAALKDRDTVLRQAQLAASLGYYALHPARDRWEGSEVLDKILGIDDAYPRTMASWLDLVYPEERAELRRYLEQRVLGSGDSFDRDYRIRRPCDGQVRWVHGRGVLETGPDGVPRRLVGVIQDITERRRREMDIREINAELERRVGERTAALEEANAELESFACSVSHDLRAPLRAICGFAQVLSRRYRAHLDADGRHYLDQVVSAGDRMGELIEALLIYSRTGQGAVRSLPVRLGPLVAELASVFGERLAACRGTLYVAEPLATPLGDPTLIRRMLGNLVENALLYRRPKTPAWVEISAIRVGAEVVLRVSDKGIGIAPEDQARIFQVFQRLHSDEDYPGTGIGLAIVQKGARSMGGSVEVSSEVGQGSTFSVRLPASPLDDGL